MLGIWWWRMWVFGVPEIHEVQHCNTIIKEKEKRRPETETLWERHEADWTELKQLSKGRKAKSTKIIIGAKYTELSKQIEVNTAT